jgi:hypothetical protein
MNFVFFLVFFSFLKYIVITSLEVTLQACMTLRNFKVEVVPSVDVGLEAV